MSQWPLTIVQEDINRYAEVSGDNNPLHVDTEFGKKSSYGSTIAHGPLTLALITRYLADDMGFAHRIAGVHVKFVGAVKPEDSLTCGAEPGTADGLEAGEVAYDVWCRNQRNEPVAVGSAVIRNEVSK